MAEQLSEKLELLTPPAAPERSEGFIEHENAFETLRDVVFERGQKPDSTAVYKSSDPSRKMIVLEGGTIIEPAAGIPYDVEVVEDTDPSNPAKGKLVVRIVGEAGVPLEERRQQEREGLPSPIAVDEGAGKVFVLDTVLPLNRESVPNVPDEKQFRHFTLDRRTLETLEKVATAVELNEPCLLEGETSTSKTSSIQYLAHQTRNGVLRLNLNGQTDTSELIGKFAPNDGQLQIQFDELLRHVDLMKPETRAILERANTQGRGLSLVESQKIAETEGIKVPDWRWQDGMVPTAMRTGQWLILDEINLAEPQVLERLNSVLERHPSLTLSENGGERIGPGGAQPVHGRFRMFATMNPAEYTGRAAMSPAYKDRWTSYKFVERPAEDDYRAMLELMVYGVQPDVEVRGQKYRGEAPGPLFPDLERVPNMRGFLAKLAKFQVTVETLAREERIGKNRKEPYIFTRRSLIEFLEYLAEKSVVDRPTGSRRTVLDAPKEIVRRALEYYYLDKIATLEDRQKVEDQLDAIGIGKKKWTHDFENKKSPAPSGKRADKPEGEEQILFWDQAGDPILITGEKEVKGYAVGDELRLKAGHHPELEGKRLRVVGFSIGNGNQHDAVIQVDGGACTTHLPHNLDECCERVGEKPETRPESVESTGRDPEGFLTRLFSTIYAEGGSTFMWSVGTDGAVVNMYSSGVELEKTDIDEKSPADFSSAYAFPEPGQGIPHLIERLRGKRILSVKDRAGGWFLRILEPAGEAKREPGEPTPETKPEPEETEKREEKKTFTGVGGGSIETTGDMRLGGYAIGDRLKVKEGRSVRKAVRDASDIRVAGFTSDGKIVIQLDGDRCVVDTEKQTQEIYELVVEDDEIKPDRKMFTGFSLASIEATGELERYGWKVGDWLIPKEDASVHPAIREAKRIVLVGFTASEQAILQLDGDKCLTADPRTMAELLDKVVED